jgi:hypothetical protein
MKQVSQRKGPVVPALIPASAARLVQAQSHGSFSLAGGMITSRTFDSALVSSAEIYIPAVSTAPPALYFLSDDGHGQGAILDANSSRNASSNDPAAAAECLEIYLKGLADDNPIPTQVSIGGRMAEGSVVRKYAGVCRTEIKSTSG